MTETTQQISYSKNLAILKLPLGADLAITKTTLADLAEEAVEKITQSGDVLGHYTRAKLLVTYCEEVIDRIKPEVVAELQHKGWQHDFIRIEAAVTGKKYDYSASVEWCETDAQMQKLAAHKKALEDAMRKNGTAKVSKEGEISPKLTLGK
ncbi:MAG: hypothetical protein JNN25_16510 [Candidatus Kapabacteria bacterium]|nr:hypothetical protein [Candidatus Kapabacteria bacterium]